MKEKRMSWSKNVLGFLLIFGCVAAGVFLVFSFTLLYFEWWLLRVCASVAMLVSIMCGTMKWVQEKDDVNVATSEGDKK